MTFCKVPWIHADINPTGKYRLCCFADDNESVSFNSLKEYWNSPHMQNIRQTFLNGEFPNQCAKCKKYEEQNITSLRQIFDQNFSGGPYSYTQKDINYADKIVNDKPICYEIFLGNTCNFSCFMCSETYSSKIASEKTAINKSLGYEKFNIKKSSGVTDEDLNFIFQSMPVHVKLLGGEPFYNKKINKILENLSEETIVEIVTNGSVISDKHIELLSKFKKVNIQVSIDGIGQTLDLTRYGADWQIINENFEKLKKLKNTWVGVNTVIYALTAENLYKLYDWAKQQKTVISPIMLANPVFMTLNAIPDHIKKQAAENIKNLDLDIEEDEPNLKRLFQDNKDNALGIAKYLESETTKYDPEKNKQLKEHLELIGNHRGIDYLEIYKDYFFE